MYRLPMKWMNVFCIETDNKFGIHIFGVLFTIRFIESGMFGVAVVVVIAIFSGCFV